MNVVSHETPKKAGNFQQHSQRQSEEIFLENTPKPFSLDAVAGCKKWTQFPKIISYLQRTIRSTWKLHWKRGVVLALAAASWRFGRKKFEILFSIFFLHKVHLILCLASLVTEANWKLSQKSEETLQSPKDNVFKWTSRLLWSLTKSWKCLNFIRENCSNLVKPKI